MLFLALDALGRLRLHRGDPLLQRAAADRMDAWLACRPTAATRTYSRARLAALRGDRERMVSLLKKAFDPGPSGVQFLQLDPDLIRCATIHRTGS